MYEAGQRFVLYTGRGPSGPVHIGHIVPWVFTRHLQEAFNAKLYFQMTDDEKFLVNPESTVDRSLRFTYENALDLVALGFDPKKTVIISDIKHIDALYNLAIKIAKHVTYSTVKAVFGFGDSSNIGIIFFPAVQAAPCFLESALTGENVPCLIPAAIDQDPYWRVTRDVAPKLGFHKPAQIHCKFLPGLGRGGKMSASLAETCIFTVDSPDVAAKKVWSAFTGGKPTTAEQRKHGGDTSICTVFYYFYYIFEESDDEIKKLKERCKSGEAICGECKAILADRVKKFLTEHQKKREKARDVVKEFFFR
jgi:tryptophanyl-tRNA synthetase